MREKAIILTDWEEIFLTAAPWLHRSFLTLSSATHIHIPPVSSSVSLSPTSLSMYLLPYSSRKFPVSPYHYCAKAQSGLNSKPKHSKHAGTKPSKALPGLSSGDKRSKHGGAKQKASSSTLYCFRSPNLPPTTPSRQTLTPLTVLDNVCVGAKFESSPTTFG